MLQPSVKPGRLGLFLLVGFALATCLANLTGGLPLGDHECINAQAARQILQSGEWLIPRLGEIPRVRKPPLGIWLIAAASRLFDDPAATPVSEFAARLPSALAAFGTTFVLFWLGRMMYGYRGGLAAGFIWAGSVAAIAFGRSALVDMNLTFFTALAFACFWRGTMQMPRKTGWLAAFYVAFALAMAAKAPLPLPIVGVALALYWLVTLPILDALAGAGGENGRFAHRFRQAFVQQWQQVRTLWVIPGTVLFIVLAFAWPVYVTTQIGQAAHLWWIEYLGRLKGDLSDDLQPLYYYVPVIFALTFPYSLSVPEAVAAPFMARYRAQRRGLAFAFTWAVWGVLFLSLPTLKRVHYPLSTIPAFCLLLAPVIERLFTGAAAGVSRRTRLACAALPCGSVAALALVGIQVHGRYPQLFGAYLVAALLLVAMVSLACRAFVRGARLAAFAHLNLGVLLLLGWTWPALARQIPINATADALAAALREHGVPADAEIYLVDGRPDSSIEFYHGYRIQRLMNELEAAELRPNRREVTATVYDCMARRIAEKLSQDRAVYLIFSGANYELLKTKTLIRHSVLLRLAAPGHSAEHESIVITQERSPNPAPPAP